MAGLPRRQKTRQGSTTRQAARHRVNVASQRALSYRVHTACNFNIYICVEVPITYRIVCRPHSSQSESLVLIFLLPWRTRECQKRMPRRQRAPGAIDTGWLMAVPAGDGSGQTLSIDGG